MLAIIAFAIAAQAEPTALDLRAIYCTRVMVHQQEALERLYMVTPPGPEREAAYNTSIAMIETRRERWYGYISPRMARLDIAALQAALDAANTDDAIVRFDSVHTPSEREEAGARMRRCNDLSPLPY